MSTARTAARACVLAALAVAAAASSDVANPPVLKANLQTTTVC